MPEKTIDAREMSSLPAMFFTQAERYSSEPFIWGKKNNKYSSFSWSETKSKVISLANNLIKKMNIKTNDRVMIIGENRPEWLVADMAVKSIGAISVPTYTTNTAVNHLHIINNSGAKLAIVSTPELAVPLITAAAVANHQIQIIIIEESDETIDTEINLIPWKDLVSEKSDETLDYDIESIKRDDPCGIIYTSGTGGLPKGVVLSHGGVLCNCDGAMDIVRLLGLGSETFLSFLPLSHSYEHAAGLHFPISLGAQIYYCERVDALINRMAEVRPTIMTAVPRLYETMRDKILKGLKNQSIFKQKLFHKTIELGRLKYENPNSLSVFDKIIDFFCGILVRRKVRKSFGGRLKALVTGGAPLNYDVGVFFTALGVKILQGYGQTEASPVISANRPDNIRLKTVGPPLRGVEVKCAKDGEILVRGELVMKEYWNDPDATIATIDSNGWLHTGDIGHIDDQGSVVITDRKKDLIVNSGGDNISPQRLEGMLCLNEAVDQALVYGDRKPYLTAIIVPNEEWINKWKKENNKTDYKLSELILENSFKSSLGKVINKVNEDNSVIEKIRKFVISDHSFTVENGQLTPTMKIRRHAVLREFSEKLDKLYK